MNGCFLLLFFCHQFSHKIKQAYERHDWLGHLAKVYLAPPLSPGQPLRSPVPLDVAKRLREPRLSLRMLASYRTLVLLGVLYLVLRTWLGTGPLTFMLLLALGLLFYGVVCVAIMQVREWWHR